MLLYDTGHIPGAVKIDWHTTSTTRSPATTSTAPLRRALGERNGISRDTTVVIYGDKSNWWAAYALWVFSLFGHEDVRLLDGGRAKWIAEGRELTRDVPTATPDEYPVAERDDAPIRAFKDDVLAHLGKPLVDVRSPASTPASCSTCPTTPRRAPCAAATSPARSRSRGPALPTTTGRSSPARSSRRSTSASRAWPPDRRRRGLLPHRRALVSTRGSSSRTCWASSRCATTTAPGPEWGNTVRVPIER